MSDPLIGVYTIGQTPRPDLTEDLTSRFASARFEIVGALDGLQAEEIPACRPDGYPLETRLREGARVVVDEAFLEPRLQLAVSAADDRVALHLVLCAGSFPHLAARQPLILPFAVSVEELSGRGLRSLEVVVPFSSQASPSARKWEAAGFACRAHALEDGSRDRSGHAGAPGNGAAETPVASWLADALEDTCADALVFDYVGFPSAFLDEVAAEIDLPVFDLGRRAFKALERTLENL